MPIHYGAHCYLFADSWSDDRLPILDTAKAAGLDIFEVVGGDDVVYTPRLIRQRAESLGLTLSVSPGGFWPVNYDLSADDPVDRARGLAWHQRQVDVAAELGAVAYTGALYGRPGVIQRRLPPAGELPRTAEGLHALAEYGMRCGVSIVIEPMSHFRTHLVNTPEQAMHLIALADHPNLRVLLDTYHLVTEIRDYAQAIHTVAPKLWGLHACESDRGVPGGGLVPWTAVFDALKTIAFEGYVLLETYNSAIGDPPGTFAFQRGMFHDPCPDGETFVRQGIAFLKAGMEEPYRCSSTTEGLHEVSFEKAADAIYVTAPKPAGSIGVTLDMTEHKRAEEALRESEGRYRILFEDSPISLWEEDFSQVKKHFDALRATGVTDFRAYFENHPKAARYCAGLVKVLDVNKATLALVGIRTKEELLAPLSSVLAEESLPVLQEELIVLAEGGQRFESEMLHRTTASETRFVTLHTSVAPGHESSLDKVLISIHDVTERKRVEDALRRAHDEMERRVNQQTAELRKANEQLTALYQVGQAITALLQLKVVLDVIARSAAELLGSDTGVILLVDEAGETLTIQGAFGLSEAVVKGTRDRVGESIAGRVVQTGQPLIVNDLPNDPRFYNPSAVDEGLLACASAPLVVGKKIIGTLDIHSKTNCHAFNEEHIHVLNLLASQAAIAIENARLYEQLQLAHNELEMRVQQRTAELVATNAQLQQDIIERKRAEEEKDTLQTQLLQAQKIESVGRLAGGVAHDYNNMLAVILIQVQLALRESDPVQRIYARLQTIQQAAQHSVDLTRQLLTFARKQAITPKVLDMNEAVEGILAMLQRLIGDGIDLLWKPAANLWLVKMDPVQINQILTNLAVNARDAIAGVGKVIIETENVTFDEAYCAVHPDSGYGDYVALTVSDDGSGMDKNILDHLFEPFFTTKEEGKGTGLGLSTVYGIVKQNDGFINVNSEPGEGSTFKIYLPRFAS